MIISFCVLECAIDRDDETNFYRSIRRDGPGEIYRAARRYNGGEFYRSIHNDDACDIDEVINIGDVRDRADGDFRVPCIPAATQLCVVEWNVLPRHQAKR